MSAGSLDQRLEEIRRRFASRLEPKFDETDASLALMTGDGAKAAEAVAASYRRFHEICGTGRTLGFQAVGEAAGKAEAVLLGPFRARRGLIDQEVMMLKEALAALRGVARDELERMHADNERKA